MKIDIPDNKIDYMRRLIEGVRKQIDQCPVTIEARDVAGEECLPAKWIDTELLCSTIEKEILKNER